MEKYIGILKRTQLFSGISEDEISAMLSCLGSELLTYSKGKYLFREGEYINKILLLVEGELIIWQDDFWGNRNIVTMIRPGEIFGEAYVSPESGTLPNHVVAKEDCTVIFFDVSRVLTVCPSACRFHSMVIKNLFFSISEKNRHLIQKIDHMSKRSTRAKLLSYLSQEAGRQNSSTFTIPFNRQQLADFLSVDRSAMSNELCKMRDEGLITFRKNEFRLL